MFGLDNKHIDFILKILDKYFKNTEYFVFGSRSKGNYKKYSDIDIALDNKGQKISSELITKAKIEFDNSTFPYEVDIVDLNSLDENFKKLIINDLKKVR